MTELAIEMRSSIISLAGERGWSETRQRWLDRAARAAGISHRAAKALFYCEDRVPRASTVECVRRAVQRRKQEEADALEKDRDILQRLSALEHWLETVDPDFHREALEGLRASSHPIGGKATRSVGDDGALDGCE